MVPLETAPEAEMAETRDPSPAEIAAQCKAIRAGWSASERRARADERPARWLPPGTHSTLKAHLGTGRPTS